MRIPGLLIAVLTVAIFMLGAARVGLSDGTDARTGTVPAIGSAYRMLTRDDSTSTSPCIGDPRTPLCAAETRMACFSRNVRMLCDIADGKRPGPPDPYTVAPEMIAKTGYRIVAARQFPPTHIPPPRRNTLGLRPWDVAISMQTANCTYGRCEGPYPGDERSFLLRQGPYGWYVVAWDNRVDYTGTRARIWACPGWDDGWTGEGPFPRVCPPPPDVSKSPAQGR